MPAGDPRPPKRVAGDVPKLLIAPRREHSRKPDETYRRIERLLPGPYLELFARQSRPGWDGIGNQEGLFDRGPVAHPAPAFAGALSGAT